MGNLYRTEEIKDIIDKKLDEMIMTAANDMSLTADDVGAVILHIRNLRGYASDLINHLKELDEKHDIEMEKWRKEREANGGT